MNKKVISLQTIDLKYKIVIEDVKKVIRSIIDKPFEITLYGSVARGEETNESDIDLLLLIDGPVDDGLMRLIWESIYPIELERDVVISLFIESKEIWETKYATLSLLFENIQREGIHA
jgi:uncharacterized protein